MMQRIVDYPYESIVYVLQAQSTDLYKIGMTVCLPSRIKLLQVGCPFELLVIATFQQKQTAKLESHFHTIYQDKWVRGEWFRLTFEDIAELRKHEAFVSAIDRLPSGRRKQKGT